MIEDFAPHVVGTRIPKSAPVIETDFAVLDIVPGAEAFAPAKAQEELPPPGIATLTPVPQARVRAFSQRGGLGFWSGGLALAAISFWIAGGYSLAMPSLAWAFSSAEEFSVSVVSSRVERLEGQTVLEVETELRNGGKAAKSPPPVAIEFTTGQGRSSQHTLPLSDDALEPGGVYRTVSRLPVPSDGVSTIRAVLRN